jgi:AcrR family transcriptional regulator
MKSMTRKYELKKRADRQDETRQRIVEAAVELHEQLGPAHTPISAIAERAGVGRPTVYRHFPDERSLFNACTSHYMAQHQLPDATAWLQIADPEERLRFGLLETYRWYRDTEPMMVVAFRDLPGMPVLAEVMEPTFTRFAAAHAVLAEGWSTAASPVLHAAIGHALAFSTWRSLAREFGLPDETVADLLTAMVVSSLRSDAPLIAG